MLRYTATTRLPVSAEEAFAWHERPGAFARLGPPGQRFRPIEHVGGITDGARNVFDIRTGPIWQRWVAVHDGYIAGRQFRDTQRQGPLPHWVHTHRFIPDGDDACTLSDEIDYALPLSPVGDLAAPLARRLLLDGMFSYRHARTRIDLARHARWADRPRLRVVVSGSTGTIGTALCAYLTTAGHRVDRLVRGTPAPASTDIVWDPTAATMSAPARARAVAELAAAIDGADAVVHLAGEPIAGRWTAARRRDIARSRIDGTALVADAVARCGRPPALLAASGTGYYGDDPDAAEADESTPPGDGFLAQVAADWERAAAPAADAGARVVHLRIGIVLAAGGGYAAVLAPLYRAGLGAVFGTGRQWVDWVALDDVLGVTEWCLHDDDVAGALNVVAPTPLRQRDFAAAFGAALHRPVVLRVPAPVLRAVAGEASVAVLGGRRVRAGVLTAAGFPFLCTDAAGALAWELRGRDPQHVVT